MKIRLITVTQKSPTWIQTGYEDYARRLPPSYAIELVEIPAEKRLGDDTKRFIEREGEKILGTLKPDHRLVALDVKGQMLSTEKFALELAKWHQDGRNLDFLIGGADGLAPEVLKKADFKWSLSPLTFPHLLVRIMVIEQFYRAYSILQKHPYHRE